MTDPRERFDKREKRSPASPAIELLAARQAGRTLLGGNPPGPSPANLDLPRMPGSARRPQDHLQTPQRASGGAVSLRGGDKGAPSMHSVAPDSNLNTLVQAAGAAGSATDGLQAGDIHAQKDRLASIFVPRGSDDGEEADKKEPEKEKELHHGGSFRNYMDLKVSSNDI